MLRNVTLLLLLAIVCTVFCCADDMTGIELDNRLEPPPIPPPVPDTQIGFLIPKPPSYLSYKVFGKLDTVASGGFSPYHDGPSFVNFSSIGTGTPYGPVYSSGTCYGICYMSSMWFGGIIRKLDEKNLDGGGSEIKTIGQRHLNFGKGYDVKKIDCFDEFGLRVECAQKDNPDEIGSIKMDGLTYLASWAKLSDANFFNKCGNGLRNCRLYKLTQNQKLNIFAKQTMTHHQFHQFSVDKIDFEVRAPRKLTLQIDEISRRITEYGSVLMYWFVYSSSETWPSKSQAETQPEVEAEELVWNKFEAGHAMLIYKISKIKVKVSGEERSGLKLHLYDPNKVYRDFRSLQTAEGMGTYLLFFPDTATISFSDKMRRMYSKNTKETAGDSLNIAVDLQGKNPVIDGKQTVVGFTDFYDGHKNQFSDAVDFETFYSGAVTTELDNRLFNLFAQAKNCENIINEIKRLKQKQSLEDYELVKQWFLENYAALQNHLRMQGVIKSEQYCDPFDS